VEYGDMVLDLHLRFRVQALYEALVAEGVNGFSTSRPASGRCRSDTTNPASPDRDVLALLRKIEASLLPISSMTVPTRIVHLPLSWDDEAHAARD